MTFDKRLMVVNSNDYFPMYSITITQFSDYPAQCIFVPTIYRDLNTQKTKSIINVIQILRNSSSKLALKNLFSSSHANRSKKRTLPMLIGAKKSSAHAKMFFYPTSTYKKLSGTSIVLCEFSTLVNFLRDLCDSSLY